MDPTYRLQLKLAARDQLSSSEAAAISALPSEERHYSAGEVLVHEGVEQSASLLLVSGVAARSKHLPDGGRQITALHIDGDFVDLHSFVLKVLEHDVIALTPVQIAVAPHQRLLTLTEESPHLTRLLWLSTLMDASIHREWIVSAGRRSALEQIGCLFCEMMVRYQMVGIARGDACPFPLTQAQLADTCGISAVHVNRVTQELRLAGLIEWRKGVLTIPDFPRLAALVGFDPAYLVLDRRSR